jgi:hypothetical protein
MNTKQGIVFKRCGCTDQDTGRQLAGHCPHLAEPGHGSWYYAVQVTTVGGRKARYRRGEAVGVVLAPHRPDHPVADLSKERIKRRPVLGGLINEYERAA